MRKTLLLFLATFLALGLLSPATATVLTFDELSGTGELWTLNPYQGIINWEVGTWYWYDYDQYPYTPKSPPTRTYESTVDTTPSWDFVVPVKFDGAWFSGGFYGDNVQMDLYYLGNLVHSTGTISPTDVPQFLASGYSGLVDRVVINTTYPDYWVMDDVTFNTAPLPGAFWLLGSGLLGLIAWRRRP